MRLRGRMFIVGCAALLLLTGLVVVWRVLLSPQAADIQTARSAFERGEYERAAKEATRWISAQRAPDAATPSALLLRGDARVAMKDYWTSLYDYEAIVRNHASTPEFRAAVERELKLGVQLVRGEVVESRFGSVDKSREGGVELLVRVQERLPDSRLAGDGTVGIGPAL